MCCILGASMPNAAHETPGASVNEAVTDLRAPESVSDAIWTQPQVGQEQQQQQFLATFHTTWNGKPRSPGAIPGMQDGASVHQQQLLF